MSRRNAFTSRAVRALDRLHRATFKCGRLPTDNDGVYLHEAFEACSKFTYAVDLYAFSARGLPLNAIAEAVRAGVLEVVEASP